MNPIKTRLREFLQAKGITPNECGTILCPFHEDNSPSCVVYDDHFHCFACGAHGDIYDMAAELRGVPCDKEHFREIAQDVESALGIVSDWKPARRKPGEPRTTIKLSQSAMYRDLLLKDFAAALDGGDLERAHGKAELLLALFLLPEGEPAAPKRRSVEEKLASYGTWGVA
ncbi:hypothetical protein FACS189483_06570 [Spirochaetia bacterium]|nr:hypothetical protein FACS189483_06570 [Spirochaetia bacterium]